MLPILALAVIVSPTSNDQVSGGCDMTVIKVGRGSDKTHLFTTCSRWEIGHRYDCNGIASPAMSLDLVDATGKRIPECVPHAKIEQPGKGVFHRITAGT